MRAVVVESHGGPETLRVREVPDPVPGPGEVVVAVRACALNHLDTWVRRGVPGHRFPLPLIPGSDAAGVLESGAAPGFRPGDEVVVAPFTSCGRCDECLAGHEFACREYKILGESRNGGCATKIAVPAANLFPKPANLTFPEAAAVLLAPLTAYHMIHARAAVRPGESVLVMAAASGVGSAAIQLARHAGARVVGVVSGEAKAEAVRALGAEAVVVVPRGDDVAAGVRAALGKRSFEVVLDSVGGAPFEGGVKLLKPFGRLVTCGATGDAMPRLEMRRVFFLSLSILGSTMGSRYEMKQVLDLAAAGVFKPVVHAVLPLDRLGEAQTILERGEAVGKVVVEP